jgi:tetratricopeptide (TPR) repeat protein
MLEVEELDGCWMFKENPASNESDVAFEKAMDAWHNENLQLAESLFSEVLAKNPFHIDAMHHLSLLYDAVGDLEFSYMAAQAAVSIGLQALPAKFQWDKARMEWGYWGNRPFMRAYHHLGLFYWDRNAVKDAIQIFSRLLAVNPMDNLGVRYLLPMCWLELNDPWNVVKHCRQHQDDSFPEITYSHALALVMIGQSKIAKTVLQEAVENLPLVKKELLKKRHPRPKGMSPDTISYGGADQAYAYWQQYGEYWEATPAAMDLLREV